MLPILLDLGFLKIYTLGVFLVLAFFWSTFYVWKNIALTSLKEDEVFDIVFLSLFGGLFLGRLSYVLIHNKEFGFSILKFILINGYPGLHFLSIVIGFFSIAGVLCYWKNIEIGKLLDHMAAPVLLAVAIVKLGAFFAGTEIGSKTAFFLSLKYPNLDGTRHLTPIYEAILFFLGTYLLHKILMEIRREKYFEGFNAMMFFMIVSLVSVFFDAFKSFRVMVGQLSLDFIISSVILLTATGYLLYHFRTSLVRFIIRKQKQ